MLNGTPGNDPILGLGGIDFLSGRAAATCSTAATAATGVLSERFGGDHRKPLGGAITVNGIIVQANTVRDGAGTIDTLISVENIVGTAAGDTLIGGAAANGLNGGAGADTIDGGDGNDIISGGPDIDSLDGGAGVRRRVVQRRPVRGSMLRPSRSRSITGGSITAFNALPARRKRPSTSSRGRQSRRRHVKGNAGNNFLGGAFGSDTIDGGASIDSRLLVQPGRRADDRPRGGDVCGNFRSGRHRIHRRRHARSVSRTCVADPAAKTSTATAVTTSSRAVPATTYCAATAVTTR